MAVVRQSQYVPYPLPRVMIYKCGEYLYKSLFLLLKYKCFNEQ